ncbi:MAG: CYTH domain-containing protein [Prevotella sp.]|nr:CYTH domain-containing protein [Prevotella sp.]
MSGLEIERKFLVKKGSAYRSAAFSCKHIRQGYIPADGVTVRIRLSDETAFLTIKGKPIDGGLTRYEFEKEITVDEAEHLLELCRGGLIDKHRYLVKSPDGRHTFEVDEFHGDNDGLVMAEVELSSPDEPYEKPDFIGPEVTGDRRFYNKHMLKYPFSVWRDTLPEEYR